MVNETDFISLKYTSDLTQAGIVYACKRLRKINNQIDKSKLKYLWQMIAEVGSELAFRRYLTLNKVPYTNLETNPFSDPDRYCHPIGGPKMQVNQLYSYSRGPI